MAINDNSYNQAQSVRGGLIVDERDGGPFYTGGVISPIGLDLPVSTIYAQTLSSGVIFWKHNSTDPDDWSPITSEIFAASPPPQNLIHNGTLSNNQLVGVSNLVNNPVTIGYRCKLNRVTTYNANNTSTADYALDFFDGPTDGGNNNGFHRHVVSNNDPQVSIVSSGPIFEPGDLLGIYYRDLGTNAGDLTVGIYLEAIPS